MDTLYTKPLPPMNFSECKVLVVGDVMLDSYWQGSTERISPEAPVPVVRIKDQSMRVGGSGNVAVNITALGGTAYLIGLVGQDKAAEDLSRLLVEQGVNDRCIQDESIPTITKLRVLSQHQQLIRLDFEDTVRKIPPLQLHQKFDALLSQVNVVVISDYAKGTVSDAAKLIQKALEKGLKVLVDPKKDDFSDYRGAYLITPNKKEFEAVAGPCATQSELELKAQELIGQYALGGLLVTQGEQGMTLIMSGKEPVHFPTHAMEVYDVTGAGDTVIAAVAAGISSGMEIEQAVHLSCVAAGIVVGRVGTAKVTQADILKMEQLSYPQRQKLCTTEEVLDFVKHARNSKKRIVMTNGCFDLLHAGHVQYLEQAAQLGDVLIVAVNSDASVKELKGESRPINALAERMTVLAGLSSVTRVVAFDQQTPEQLICEIKPDVLVKGGDYQVDQIAGRQCAEEVVLISLVAGQSTTNIVTKIKEKI